MNYKLIQITNFERPLKGIPQLLNGKLWFPYIDYQKSDTKSYFGIMGYDLAKRSCEYYPAPFYTEDKYITANYFRLVMHPCIGDSLSLSLGWEEMNDIKYRLFKIRDNSWNEITTEKDANNIININESTLGNQVKPDSQLSLKRYALNGGALHCWTEKDEICFTTDTTHAFERDSSSFTEKNNELEDKLKEVNLEKSNLHYMRLSEFLKKHSLPKETPKNHPILDRENLHDYWVLKNDDYLFFLNNDFHKRGYVEMLHYQSN